MNEVKLVNGKLVVSKETTTKGNGKPAKYPYPQSQFDSLLKLAKAAGVDVGSTKAANTKAVNAVCRAVLEGFIADQNKPKTE